MGSVLPGLFIQSHDFTHDVFALYGGVEAFAGVFLFFFLFIFHFFFFQITGKTCLVLKAASEDGVGVCTLEILGFTHLFYS